ncbi:MAG: hypothetical protein ACHQK8_03335 [Bacteroidia bacterium]
MQNIKTAFSAFYLISCNYLLLNFIFILTVLLFSSCVKNYDDGCGNPPTYRYLTSDEKSKIPYSVTDSIKFVSSNNDTIIFRPGSKWKFQSFYDHTPFKCQNYYDENLAYVFYSPTQSRINWIELMAALTTNLYNCNGYGLQEHVILINANTGNSVYLDDLTYMVDANYKDTLTINGKIFYGHDLMGCDSSRLFYNHHEGILRIKFPDNQVWLKQ